ncbi:MarR family winged helix-turn-helix transcriptional regulator [Treponema pectinovorum]|uniref:MarR family winged helix-turn-helix transcriptional regulator n=1 Tax=Treponema pectinovorum TaxID=164 RepID=UPI0011C81B46|nr:MarR family transcriptional regulator [Treponema pectinovorum]
MSEQEKYDCLKLSNQLCFPLYAASREILRQYTSLLKGIDLTYTQYIVMLVLWEKEELTIGELCKALYLDTGTISPMLKAMEEKNLLTRNREKNDSRIVKIKITEQGKNLKEKALYIPQKMVSCLKLEKNEMQQLYTILYKILPTN